MDPQHLSSIAKNLKKSVIQKVLEEPCTNDAISFSLGFPDTSILPLNKYKISLEGISSPGILQYSPPLLSLKNHITKLMKARQVECNPEQIILTSGAQQAMMLICKLLVDKGDSVIIEEATYPGFIQVARSVQANLVPVAIDSENGIIIEQLEKLLAKIRRPKLFYTISDGHNPLGTNLSKTKRLEIINIFRSYNIPIVEDDVYGFINYNKLTPPLRSYASDLVFYIGSFSKILSPSTRLGWIVAPESVIEKLEMLKQCIDINTSTMAQYIINNYIDQGYLSEHLNFLKTHYKKKRDIMVDALKYYIPETKFCVPDSGFFIWSRLNNNINTSNLFLKATKKYNVSFLPGAIFGVGSNNSLSNCLRLSFALCDASRIELGIRMLKQALTEYKQGL